MVHPGRDAGGSLGRGIPPPSPTCVSHGVCGSLWFSPLSVLPLIFVVDDTFASPTIAGLPPSPPPPPLVRRIMSRSPDRLRLRLLSAKATLTSPPPKGGTLLTLTLPTAPPTVVTTGAAGTKLPTWPIPPPSSETGAHAWYVTTDAARMRRSVVVRVREAGRAAKLVGAAKIPLAALATGPDSLVVDVVDPAGGEQVVARVQLRLVFELVRAVRFVLADVRVAHLPLRLPQQPPRSSVPPTRRPGKVPNSRSSPTSTSRSVPKRGAGRSSSKAAGGGSDAASSPLPGAADPSHKSLRVGVALGSTPPASERDYTVVTSPASMVAARSGGDVSVRWADDGSTLNVTSTGSLKDLVVPRRDGSSVCLFFSVQTSSSAADSRKLKWHQAAIGALPMGLLLSSLRSPNMTTARKLLVPLASVGGAQAGDVRANILIRSLPHVAQMHGRGIHNVNGVVEVPARVNGATGTASAAASYTLLPWLPLPPATRELPPVPGDGTPALDVSGTSSGPLGGSDAGSGQSNGSGGLAAFADASCPTPPASAPAPPPVGAASAPTTPMAPWEVDAYFPPPPSLPLPPGPPLPGAYGAYPPSAPPAPLVRSNSGTSLAIHPRFVAAARAAGPASWVPPHTDRPLQAYEGATFGIGVLSLDGNSSGGVGVAPTDPLVSDVYDSVGSASTLTTLGSAEEPSGAHLHHAQPPHGRGGGALGLYDTNVSVGSTGSSGTIHGLPVGAAPSSEMRRGAGKFTSDGRLREEEPLPPPPEMPAALMYG